jgi:hypothetical protein
MRDEVEISPRKIIALAIGLLLTFMLSISACSLVENVRADELVIIQGIGGKLNCYTSQGPKIQAYGSVTSYPRRSQYEFETQVRFNDGGHGTMKGSIQWEMPTDCNNIINLHRTFGSPESIQKQLIEKVVNKSVYMTGPLMTSKESYAEKRNYLISYVDDQIKHGVYRTIQREVKVADQLTGQEKSAVIVELVMKDGQPERQEEAVLSEFGIKPFNFAIDSLTYDDKVEAQIQQQQQITMDVQTAIANARKAEQDKLTSEQRGAAEAAKAKWEQEVIKAKEVTAAQQRLEVAKLDNQVAEQYKQKKLLEAEADATYRRKVMEADGALQQRLDAFVKVNQAYAQAIQGAQTSLVPGVVMGGKDGQAPGIQELISLLVAQTAAGAGVKKEQ